MKKKLILLMLISIVVINIVSYLKTEKKSDEIIFAYHLSNGSRSNTIPSKYSGETFDSTKSRCNNGVTIDFDYANWSINLNYENYNNSSNTLTRCEIYFKEDNTTAYYIHNMVNTSDSTSTAVIDKGTDESGCTNTLAYDDFGNLRFVGSNPCNYIALEGTEEVETDTYMIYANGDISTGAPRVGTFSTLSACESFISGNMNGIGLDGEKECKYNETTNNYYVNAHGYLTGLGEYQTETDCENAIKNSSVGMSTQTGADTYTIPSGLSCNNKIQPNSWRIIGVVDGKVKLIRTHAIGNYSWDTSTSSINNGYGISQWGDSGEYTGADLMKLLNPGFDTNLAEDNNGNVITGTYVNNSLYWNKASGNCYYNSTNAYRPCDFRKTGLQEDAKGKIENHQWIFGTTTSTSNTAKDFYVAGLGQQLTTYHLDNVERRRSWNGYVGLIHPSDYGYAVGGTVRSTCLTTTLDNYNSNNCATNNWLLENNYQFTMLLQGGNFNDVYGISLNGDLQSYSMSSGYLIKPVVYLKQDVSIVGGNGTIDNPYTLHE